MLWAPGNKKAITFLVEIPREETSSTCDTQNSCLGEEKWSRGFNKYVHDEIPNEVFTVSHKWLINGRSLWLHFVVGLLTVGMLQIKLKKIFTFPRLRMQLSEVLQINSNELSWKLLNSRVLRFHLTFVTNRSPCRAKKTFLLACEYYYF